MNDPKLEGAPILRRTLCKAGTHSWVWNGFTSWGGRLESRPSLDMYCDCGLYRWGEAEVGKETLGMEA